MRVSIHCEPSGGTALGGAELAVAVLAHALADEYTVRIVQHRSGVTSERLGEFAGVDLSAVETRYLPPPPTNAWTCGQSTNPVVRYRDARAWQRDLSVDSDVFITFTHGVPPFCHAPAGILVVLFPLFRRNASWPWIDSGATSMLRRTSRRAYFDWEWKRRLDSYQDHLSISAFAREWTRAWWGLDTEVVSPPVDVDFAATTKQREVLSVGRFSTMGVSKRQLELVTLFSALHREIPGWRYRCTGALGRAPEDAAYFERVRGAAMEACDVEANLSRPALKSAFEQASLFWHAAGFGERESERPELAEHFGVATVEAMAAGCVPLAFNSGGQREIIEHGVSGFLWNSMDELAQLTQQLTRDDRCRIEMSERARRRAQAFSTARFVREMRRHVHDLAASISARPLRRIAN